MGDVKVFKPKLETVLIRGEEIKTSVPEEHTEVIAGRVTELTERWHQLQNMAEVRTAELQEAGELWEKFDDSAHFLTGFVEHSHNVAKSKIVWTDMESVEMHLAEQRVIYCLDTFPLLSLFYQTSIVFFI